MTIIAYVYLIESATTGKYYVGYTKDLKERIRQHDENEGKWTRNKGPWQLRYYESFTEDTPARIRELQLKKAKNKRYLSWLIDNGPGTSAPIPPWISQVEILPAD